MALAGRVLVLGTALMVFASATGLCVCPNHLESWSHWLSDLFGHHHDDDHAGEDCDCGDCGSDPDGKACCCTTEGRADIAQQLVPFPRQYPEKTLLDWDQVQPILPIVDRGSSSGPSPPREQARSDPSLPLYLTFRTLLI